MEPTGKDTSGTEVKGDLPSRRWRGSTRPACPVGGSRPLRGRWERFGSGALMSMNLTPMIDLVFLLLFFFLTVSRFRAPEGMLPAQLPAQTAAVSTEIPRTPIRIRFVADAAWPGECLVSIDRSGEPPMPIGELTPALKAIQSPEHGFDTHTPVHLLAAGDVAWDHVVNAYNAALAARYEKIFFGGSP